MHTSCQLPAASCMLLSINFSAACGCQLEGWMPTGWRDCSMEAAGWMPAGWRDCSMEAAAGDRKAKFWLTEAQFADDVTIIIIYTTPWMVFEQSTRELIQSANKWAVAVSIGRTKGRVVRSHWQTSSRRATCAGLATDGMGPEQLPKLVLSEARGPAMPRGKRWRDAVATDQLAIGIKVLGMSLP